MAKQKTHDAVFDLDYWALTAAEPKDVEMMTGLLLNKPDGTDGFLEVALLGNACRLAEPCHLERLIELRASGKIMLQQHQTILGLCIKRLQLKLEREHKREIAASKGFGGPTDMYPMPVARRRKAPVASTRLA